MADAEEILDGILEIVEDQARLAEHCRRKGWGTESTEACSFNAIRRHLALQTFPCPLHGKPCPVLSACWGSRLGAKACVSGKDA